MEVILLSQIKEKSRDDAPLLHNRSELPDTLPLLAEYILWTGGANNNFGAEGSHAHLDSSVSFLRQLLCKELYKPNILK